MGVNTTADGHRDQAKANIVEAINHLSAIVINQCWGHDEYNTEYQCVLKKTLLQLIDIRDEL